MKTIMTRSIFLLVTLFPTFSSAMTVNSMFVFGDSLSDGGNVYNATFGQFPPAPYDQRFSNGLVAVERLATMVGVSLKPSSSIGGGTNFAYGGADTGVVPGTSFDNYVAASNPLTPLAGLNGTGIQTQVAEFNGTVFDPATSLFVVWGGANDIFTQLDGLTAATIDQVIGSAVGNLINSIATLTSYGAQNFLVPNLVDLGYTPMGISAGGPQQIGLSQITNGFNLALNQGLDSLVNQTIFRPDLNHLLSLVQANPGAYGFNNVTDACFDRSTFTSCANPDQYLFWDSVHPTTTGHAVLAKGLNAVLIPEPSAILLIGLGVFLIGFRGYRVN